MWEFEKFQEQIALIDENTFLTYKELMEYTDKMKQILEERSFCFLLCDAGIGPMIHYISMIENRVVPLLLDVKIDKKLLQELINEYQPDYLCVPENLDEYQEEKAIEHSYGYKTIEWSKAKRQPLYEDLALLLSTSGSTGSNKLVRLSYKNIYSNAKSISEYLQLDETERPITTLPMNYTYGLSIINSHLLVGATILVSSRTFIQKGFWEFFEKHGATSFGGVPATYDILYKSVSSYIDEAEKETFKTALVAFTITTLCAVSVAKVTDCIVAVCV